MNCLNCRKQIPDGEKWCSPACHFAYNQAMGAHLIPKLSVKIFSVIVVSFFVLLMVAFYVFLQNK